MKHSSSARAAKAFTIFCGICWLSGMACSQPVRSALTESAARDMVPVPICVSPVPRGGDEQHVVSLTAEEFRTVLFPGKKQLKSGSVDCAGHRPLEKLPAEARPAAVLSTVAPGADRMKIVWLTAHHSSPEGKVGTLALLRQVGGVMEVYATGSHVARSPKPQFALERMGSALVVTATDQSCAASGHCTSSTRVYLMRTGRLKQAAEFPVEFFMTGVTDEEPMELQYQFNASANFGPTGIKLTEHISVQDPGHGEVRSSDLERTLTFQKRTLVPSAPSLWDTLVQRIRVKK